MATSKSLPVGEQRALRHQPRRADGLDAAAEIDADRQDVALRRGLRADAADVLVEQILEFGALALVAGRAHVGDVVGDDLDVEFLGHHSGRRGVKCAHGLSPFGSGRNFGELLDRAVRRRSPCCWQHAGDLGVGARELDHARHLDDAAHVRLLDASPARTRTLAVRGGCGVTPFGRGEEARSVLLQLLRRCRSAPAAACRAPNRTSCWRLRGP